MKVITFLTLLGLMALPALAQDAKEWIVPGDKLQGKKTPTLKVKTEIREASFCNKEW